MEDSKLEALYVSLKAGAPRGRVGGLGASGGGGRVRSNEAPKNALYARFVPAGSWNPDNDLVSRDFSGNRLKLGTEDSDTEINEPHTSVAPQSDVASTRSDRKPKRRKEVSAIVEQIKADPQENVDDDDTDRRARRKARKAARRAALAAAAAAHAEAELEIAARDENKTNSGDANTTKSGEFGSEYNQLAEVQRDKRMRKEAKRAAAETAMAAAAAIAHASRLPTSSHTRNKDDGDDDEKRRERKRTKRAAQAAL